MEREAENVGGRNSKEEADQHKTQKLYLRDRMGLLTRLMIKLSNLDGNLTEKQLKVCRKSAFSVFMDIYSVNPQDARSTVKRNQEILKDAKIIRTR